MKTINQINRARDVLCKKLKTTGLSESQAVMFAGMLNALVWVADGLNASTMDRLLDGEPIAPAKTRRRD